MRQVAIIFLAYFEKARASKKGDLDFESFGSGSGDSHYQSLASSASLAIVTLVRRVTDRRFPPETETGCQFPTRFSPTLAETQTEHLHNKLSYFPLTSITRKVRWKAGVNLSPD